MSPKVAKALIALGADLNQGTDGTTALHEAAWSGLLEETEV